MARVIATAVRLSSPFGCYMGSLMIWLTPSWSKIAGTPPEPAYTPTPSRTAIASERSTSTRSPLINAISNGRNGVRRFNESRVLSKASEDNSILPALKIESVATAFLSLGWISCAA